MIPVIAVIGMILNGLSLPVLASRHFRQSSYTYLAALAIADLLSLLLFSLNAVGKGHFSARYSWVVFEAKVYLPCGFMCNTVSMLLTVSVAMERCVFFYSPARAKQWCSHKQAREMVLFISACGICYSVPGYFAYDISDDPPFRVAFTEFGRGWFHIALCWVHVLIVSFGSCIALIIFNVLLIRGLRAMQHPRRPANFQPSGQQRQKLEEARLTLMLVSVFTVFVIGELPAIVVSRSSMTAMETITGHDVTHLPVYRMASLVATILVVMQHSANFLIYCLSNRHFLAVLQAKLCRPANHKRTADVTESPPSRRLVQTLNT